VADYIDQLTLAIGFIIVPAKIVHRKLRNLIPAASRVKCGNDFLNGCMIAPFALLGLSIFSENLSQHLQKGNAAILSIAGVIGLIFISGELLS
jgi:hypothetical protein